MKRIEQPSCDDYVCNANHIDHSWGNHFDAEKCPMIRAGNVLNLTTYRSLHTLFRQDVASTHTLYTTESHDFLCGVSRY